MRKISTICSSYKSINKIEILINSFISQNYNDKELIIVDGTTNYSEHQSFKNKIIQFENIKIFHLPNASIYACLNFGIKKSSGEIINIMGDDDRYFNNKIFSKISDYFNKSIDYVYGDTLYEKNKKLKRFYKSFDLNKNFMRIGYMPSHTSLFLLKKVYNDLGEYNLKYLIASDLDYFFRLYNNKKLNYVYTDEIISIMSMGGISNKSYTNLIKSNLEAYKILKKYKYSLASFRILFKLFFKLYLKLFFSIKYLNS